MRLGSLTWSPTQRAMPQERNDSESLRSKTWTVQSGWAVRSWEAAKVPACVQPTIAAVVMVEEPLSVWHVPTREVQCDVCEI